MTNAIMNDTTAEQATVQQEPLHTYDYSFNPGPFQRLLYYSAGTDVQLLRHCTNYDRVKMQGIGGTVLATGVLAFLSGSFALYTIFGPSGQEVSAATSALWFVFSCIAGLVWAAVIYNLDRLIVSTTGHGDGTEDVTLNEFMKAIPRLVMAIMIGFVIAKPLEIRIMQKEINAELKVLQETRANELRTFESDRMKERVAEASKAKAELEGQRLERIADIKKKEEARDKADADLKAEMDGGAGGRGRGKGPVAEQKERLLEERKAELQEAQARLLPEQKALEVRIAKLEEQIAGENAAFEQKEAGFKRDAAELDGLMTRVDIAHEKYFWSGLLISAVFIFVEVAPLFFKMLMPLSPIDYLTENQKRLTLTRRGIWMDRGIEAHGAPVDGQAAAPAKTNGRDVKQARYLEDELSSAQVVGKLRVDAALTDEVQRNYEEAKQAEIRSNPTAFIVPASEAAKA